MTQDRIKTGKRRRTDPSPKAMDAAGIEVVNEKVNLRGFYSRFPEPEKIVCKRCGEERNSIGQEDGHCLRCRWELKARAPFERNASLGKG
jgi:tRNA(Ile2) C34 agmatinyltransferase TiaS